VYFEWQVRFMSRWFNQSGMPGRITRLLSAGGTDFLASEIPTHVSPPYVSKPGDTYLPYNKPYSIMRWLAEAPPSEVPALLASPFSE
jgi:hypothetical protein